jgi:uncharacterized repeat protein (TIGR03809 family)
MSDRPPARALAQVAQKWRDLAERRRAHFIELYHSGRWKHYYSEEQFLGHMREAIRAVELWARVAPRSTDESPTDQAPTDRASAAPAARPGARTAA